MLVVVLGDVVAVISMAALVAVMIFVSISTFDRHSLRTLHVMPRSETTVMLTTVAGTLLTHDLAVGVGAGVLTACVLLARRVAHLVEVTSGLDADGTTRTYQVHGALSLASRNDLSMQVYDAGDPPRVRIEPSQARVRDASTVAALDAITHTYALRGTSVEIVGLDGHSADRFERHTGPLAGTH